ncbi:hypothetical protein FHS40_007071 [Streptomyces spectabilis]|uniref:Uncharacterized protein n=1 Tax=Streptomyces spectabilis TaxID=68270 RepID=A0A7W8EYQ7_STRST|nr:hypothetical protein [Streptomyces spectabilis]
MLGARRLPRGGLRPGCFLFGGLRLRAGGASGSAAVSVFRADGVRCPASSHPGPAPPSGPAPPPPGGLRLSGRLRFPAVSGSPGWRCPVLRWPVSRGLSLSSGRADGARPLSGLSPASLRRLRLSGLMLRWCPVSPCPRLCSLPAACVLPGWRCPGLGWSVVLWSLGVCGAAPCSPGRRPVVRVCAVRADVVWCPWPFLFPGSWGGCSVWCPVSPRCLGVFASAVRLGEVCLRLWAGCRCSRLSGRFCLEG